MGIEEALAALVGHEWDVDGAYGLQCKDVADQYCLFLFGDWVNTIRPENARLAFDRANMEYFIKVANNPDDLNQFPPRGAVIVWDSNMGGGDGHIAVVEDADANGMNVIEQDGFKQVAAYRAHYFSYKYVIGWLIPILPKEQEVAQTMTAQEFKDAYWIVLEREPDVGSPIPDGRSAMQFIYDAVGELKAKRTAMKSLDGYSLGDLLSAAFKKTFSIK